MQQEQEVYRNENNISQYRYIQSSVLLSAADRILVDFSGIPESLNSCIASCFHLLLWLFSDASSCISHVSSFAFGISPNEGRHSFIWLALLQLSVLSSQLSVRKDNTRNNVGFDTEMNSFLSLRKGALHRVLFLLVRVFFFTFVFNQEVILSTLFSFLFSICSTKQILNTLTFLYTFPTSWCRTKTVNFLIQNC